MSIFSPQVVAAYYGLVEKIYKELWGDRFLHGGFFTSQTGNLLEAQEEMINQVVKEIPSSANRVLDLGCGYGVLGIALALKYPHVQVVGITISQEQARAANRAAVAAGVSKRTKFMVCDAHNLSELGEFDAVMSAEAMFHMRHEQVLQQIYQVLTPGGKLVFTDIVRLKMKWWQNLVFKAMGAINEYADTSIGCPNLRKTMANIGYEQILVTDISSNVSPTMPATLQIFAEKKAALVEKFGALQVRIMEISWNILAGCYDGGVGYIKITTRKT